MFNQNQQKKMNDLSKIHLRGVTCKMLKEKLKDHRVHLFSNKFSIVILFGMNLLGCAGSTTVHHQHHLLLENSSKAFVCFMRPSEGFMGVRGMPIGIDLDDENLLDLSIGQYTFLDLKPGKYDMVVTSWTVEGPNNAQVQTSRSFVLDLAEADSVYLLFTLEKIDFWTILGQKLTEQIDTLGQKISELVFPDRITIPLGKHVSLLFILESESQLASQINSQPGIGYTVESVSRETAIEVESKLEPVEGAQSSLLSK